MDEAGVRHTVEATLRFLMDGWVSDADAEAMRECVEKMQTPVNSWTFCPLCSEVVCDDHCPLYPVRVHAELWVAEERSADRVSALLDDVGWSR